MFWGVFGVVWGVLGWFGGDSMDLSLIGNIVEKLDHCSHMKRRRKPISLA